MDDDQLLLPAVGIAEHAAQNTLLDVCTLWCGQVSEYASFSRYKNDRERTEFGCGKIWSVAPLCFPKPAFFQLYAGVPVMVFWGDDNVAR